MPKVPIGVVGVPIGLLLKTGNRVSGPTPSAAGETRPNMPISLREYRIQKGLGAIVLSGPRGNVHAQEVLDPIRPNFS